MFQVYSPLHAAVYVWVSLFRVIPCCWFFSSSSSDRRIAGMASRGSGMEMSWAGQERPKNKSKDPVRQEGGWRSEWIQIPILGGSGLIYETVIQTTSCPPPPVACSSWEIIRTSHYITHLFHPNSKCSRFFMITSLLLWSDPLWGQSYMFFSDPQWMFFLPLEWYSSHDNRKNPSQVVLIDLRCT